MIYVFSLSSDIVMALSFLTMSTRKESFSVSNDLFTVCNESFCALYTVSDPLSELRYVIDPMSIIKTDTKPKIKLRVVQVLRVVAAGFNNAYAAKLTSAMMQR